MGPGSRGFARFAGDRLTEPLIVRFALVLAPADDALALETAELGGDDGALVFAVGAVVVEQDPIGGFPYGVGVGGVGEQRGVVARAAARVQDGKPGLARRIEAERRDFFQLIGRRGGPIFAVDVEQFRHAGRSGGDGCAG